MFLAQLFSAVTQAAFVVFNVFCGLLFLGSILEIFKD